MICSERGIRASAYLSDLVVVVGIRERQHRAVVSHLSKSLTPISSDSFNASILKFSLYRFIALPPLFFGNLGTALLLYHSSLEPAISVPLLSVHPWYPLNMSLLIANSLPRGTTVFHGSSELDIRVNSWTRVFAVLTETKDYIIFLRFLAIFVSVIYK